MLAIHVLTTATATIAETSPVDGLWNQAQAMFARRAEGADGAIADAARADAAVDAYRLALAESPRDLVRLAGLLHALYFRGTYCGESGEAKKALFEEGRRLGQSATDTLEAPLEGLARAEQLARLRNIPGAAEVYYWSMANWGEWALVAGPLAAAVSGVGGMMLHHGTTVAALDPTIDDGGADRALGRLHHQSPRIPLLTGWVSKPQALVHLRRSLSLSPQSRGTWVFLAEAILDYEPDNRQEALTLLQRAASEAPRPDYAVEDAHYAKLARAALAKLP